MMRRNGGKTGFPEPRNCRKLIINSEVHVTGCKNFYYMFDIT
jgi:hypothetical protein